MESDDGIGLRRWWFFRVVYFQGLGFGLHKAVLVLWLFRLMILAGKAGPNRLRPLHIVA
jgi:hypothetical protein